MIGTSHDPDLDIYERRRREVLSDPLLDGPPIDRFRDPHGDLRRDPLMPPPRGKNVWFEKKISKSRIESRAFWRLNCLDVMDRFFFLFSEKNFITQLNWFLAASDPLYPDRYERDPYYRDHPSRRDIDPLRDDPYARDFPPPRREGDRDFHHPPPPHPRDPLYRDSRDPYAPRLPPLTARPEDPVYPRSSREEFARRDYEIYGTPGALADPYSRIPPPPAPRVLPPVDYKHSSGDPLPAGLPMQTIDYGHGEAAPRPAVNRDARERDAGKDVRSGDRYPSERDLSRDRDRGRGDSSRRSYDDRDRDSRDRESSRHRDERGKILFYNNITIFFCSWLSSNIEITNITRRELI